MSVPNQNCADGSFSRCTGATAWGSAVASHGASTATSSIAASTTPPAIAVGWRRRASRKRRQMSDDSARGPGSASAVTSIPYARIEQHVGQVDREVDQHVERREDENHTLDDGIVAAQDGVDGETAHARDGEHRFRDDRTAHEERDADADDRHDRDGG